MEDVLGGLVGRLLVSRCRIAGLVGLGRHDSHQGCSKDENLQVWKLVSMSCPTDSFFPLSFTFMLLVLEKRRFDWCLSTSFVLLYIAKSELDLQTPPFTFHRAKKGRGILRWWNGPRERSHCWNINSAYCCSQSRTCGSPIQPLLVVVVLTSNGTCEVTRRDEKGETMKCVGHFWSKDAIRKWIAVGTPRDEVFFVNQSKTRMNPRAPPRDEEALSMPHQSQCNPGLPDDVNAHNQFSFHHDKTVECGTTRNRKFKIAFSWRGGEGQ